MSSEHGHGRSEAKTVVTKVIAHRGASGDAPENTLRAFEQAVLMGADGIELDVQLTRDGEVVVIHDETVDRTTTGTGRVNSYTLAEIRTLDAGSWFASDAKAQRIPHLREVLDLLKGTNLLLNVELKNDIVPYEGMEAKVCALLQEYPNQLALVSSFNHYSLRTIKHICPATNIALLYTGGLVEPWLYAQRQKAIALNPYYPNIVPELVAGCRGAGIALYAWTVNSEENMKRLLAAGIEGIMTDYPARLLALRASP